MNTSRREFLKTLSTGAAISMLRPIENLFQGKLEEVIKNGKIPSAKEYSVSKRVKYLNHGSTGTIPKIVQEAHHNYLEMCESNPWLYMWSGEWDEPVQKVRKSAAQYINAETDELSFSHNTTEIYNLLALGLHLNAGDEVLFSSINHVGASIPFHIHSKKRNYSVKVFDFPVDDLTSITKQDIIDLYEINITNKTKLLILPHIDNTFGVRQPVKEITAMARAKGVEFISLDTAQTMGMIPINVKNMDIDVIGTSGHKWIQAPKGISVSYFSKRVQDRIDPMWVTWGQERWKNSVRIFEDYGTRNIAEVLTLGHSIDFQKAVNEQAKSEKLKSLWNYAQELCDKNPNTVWRSPRNWDLGGSLFVVEVKNHKPSELAQNLFKNHGFVFRPFDAYSTIRISPNYFNTKDELDELFSLI